MVALGVSVLMQVVVWRAVTSNGDEDEDDDFKIRTEKRRLEDMKRVVEEQQVVIAKLEEASSVLLKEKADVKAMHDHAHGDEDQLPLDLGTPVTSYELNLHRTCKPY